jgi:ATP-dependent DNA ligase
VLLSEVVEASAEVAATRARSAKIDTIAALLRRVPPAEVMIAVAFLSGDLLQGQIGVGYAALGGLLRAGRLAEPAPGSPGLTLTDADAAFTRIGSVAGAGSQAERRRLLAGLFARATAPEQEFLARLLSGDLRQGALEGIMTEAVARASDVPAGEVRRAHQVGGSLPEVALAALAGIAPESTAPESTTPEGTTAEGTTAEGTTAEGTTAEGTIPVTSRAVAPQRALAALREITLRVGRPVHPMLAASAPDVGTALSRVSPAAVEWKIDGIRIQVHRSGGEVAVFTRTLDEITSRVPELVEAALAIPAQTMVLDGEAVALGDDERPRPFQVTAARTASQADVARLAAQTPLTAFLFDLLHLDGTDLIDEPARERYQQLAAIVPAALLTPRLVTGDHERAEEFFAAAVARGHEGVVVKSLDAAYRAGRRGGEWIKVKPRHTLDLVILAAEWGHGRRRGVLSNLHLGARDPGTGDLVMLGKTFKGLTDEMLAWQTERLLSLADPAPDIAAGYDRHAAYGTVRVRPELVVEVAFDGVQASRRYPGGVALRFARVLRFRPDKNASEADTIDTVRSIWAYGTA